MVGGRRRGTGSLALAAALVAVLSPQVGTAAGSQRLSPPYAEAFASHECSNLDLLSTCTGSEAADVRTGAVTLERRVTAPQDGALPGSGGAFAQALFREPYTIKRPVPEAWFTVRIHVNRAQASVSGALFHATRPVLSSYFGYAYGVAFMIVDYLECSSCSIFTSDYRTIVDATDGPEPVEDQDLMLRVRLTSDSGDVPPGRLFVRAGVLSSQSIGLDTGSAYVAVDAVVTSILVAQ